MKRILAFLLLGFSFCFSNAETVAGKDDRYVRFKEFEGKADEGYSWAQYHVGKYYKDGLYPVSKDLKKAEEYFLKAAHQRNKRAVLEMASIWAARASNHNQENVVELIKWNILYNSVDSSDGIKNSHSSFASRSSFSESSITEGLRRAKEFRFSMEGKGGYEVVNGDTVRGVCKRLGLTEEQFRALNPGLDFKSRLNPGQILMTK
jgi:TPR repeat protein